MKSIYASPLGRQIMVSVLIATMSSVFITIIGLYLAYGLIDRFAPGLVFSMDGGWLPNGIEWMIIGTLSAIAMSISAFSASALAKHIILPVVSVAANARKIADGDLTARVQPHPGTLSELSILVKDFNLLATRLQAASEAVTQWNATIAHELRTPVTILRGRLQALADGVFEPEPKLLRALEAQVISLSQLIEDLRTVTLFDSGHLHASLSRVNLATTIETTADLMRPDLIAAGFSIDLQLAPIFCDADVGRIHQVVMALLENAKRHANPGVVTITLAQRRGLVHLSICDQGPGLPSDFEAHAFDPFKRYIVQGEVPKSSGLGLSVVRAIAEIHGGTATYDKVKGGACFTIIFPIAE